jgi:tetratricopeptide (TPR) repeat protein
VVRAKGFAALAVVAALAVAALAVVAGLGLGAVTTTGKDSSAGTPSSLQPIYGGHESPARLRAQFEQVVKHDPGNMYGWYNLGVVEDSVGRHEAAATDYLQAIAIKPDFESALYNLGVIRMQARDYPAAVSLLGRAVAANPKDAVAHFRLGLALANLQTPAAATTSTTRSR